MKYKFSFFLLLAFLILSCEKTDEENNNIVTSNDPIVGYWDFFYEEIIIGNTWNGNNLDKCCFSFLDNGTWSCSDDFNGPSTNGTWENTGNNIYLIYYSSGANFPDTWEVNFYCDNNIMIDIAGLQPSNQVIYWQKQGYNFFNCNNIPFNITPSP